MHEVLSGTLLAGVGVLVVAYTVEGAGFLYMLWSSRQKDPEAAALAEDDEAFM